MMLLSGTVAETFSSSAGNVWVPLGTVKFGTKARPLRAILRTRRRAVLRKIIIAAPSAQEIDGNCIALSPPSRAIGDQIEGLVIQRAERGRADSQTENA